MHTYMYICIFIYTHQNMCTSVYIYQHTFTHTRIYTYTCIYMYTHKQLHTHAHTHLLELFAANKCVVLRKYSTHTHTHQPQYDTNTHCIVQIRTHTDQFYLIHIHTVFYKCTHAHSHLLESFAANVGVVLQ